MEPYYLIGNEANKMKREKKRTLGKSSISNTNYGTVITSQC
jgi:hypothetical protein